ncbi:hypothetical protein [Halarsenatibacter silvermanii]|uniref:Uncharacterized protein n=1 Tax=Halarsenatibacter silvermanii TaxID=321763 RepID=A0A1G9LWN5_9FIRM|nr:hypothetical protein [Halarsenatibacter silvermanii]SDL66323.1 hypothetical protein SAMN04488692_10733 [Halarsenatibacter silvermanii]
MANIKSYLRPIMFIKKNIIGLSPVGVTAGVISMFILLAVLAAPLQAESNDNGLRANNWWQNLHVDQGAQVISLEHEELELPENEENYRSFSEQGREKLYDLASQFDDGDSPEDTADHLMADGDSRNPDYSGAGLSELKTAEDDSFTSRLSLNAIETEDEFYSDGGELTGVDVELSLSDSTALSAGFSREQTDQLHRRENSAEELDYLEYEDDFSGLESNSSAGNMNEGITREGDYLWSDGEETETGRLGVNYSPLEELSLSAGFTYEDLYLSPSRQTAELGFEYSDINNHLGERVDRLRANYEVDEGDMFRERTTGLELDVMDSAMLSASYSLLDIEEIEDKLQQQTTLDLGLGVDFTELGSMFLGYQRHENLLFPEDEEGEDEYNIRASFTIDF